MKISAAFDGMSVYKGDNVPASKRLAFKSPDTIISHRTNVNTFS